jgi:demethoxyubiquinone hydroxylase (CLK1/Coq7/Cat5 family)
MDIKKEGLGLVKTLGAIITSFGVVWVVLEPIVVDYLDAHLEEYHKEDKAIQENLKQTLDEDFQHNIEKRNEIIDEIKRFHYSSRLNKE